jgi:acyl dehydratase
VTAVSSSLTYAGIEVGDRLPALVKVPTTEQLVRYAGAAHDFARIHYDHAHAVQRGFDGVIVHGLLKAAFLGQLVTAWCGPGAWVRRFAVQYRRVDVPGRPIICHGTVRAKHAENGREAVDLELWTENPQGVVTTKGTSTVVFGDPTEVAT